MEDECRMGDFGYSQKLKRRVLVVDDEEINRDILGNILEGEYEVSYAENGKQAYDMLHDRMAHYSLVLLDLLMPVMDGFELLEKIRSEDAQLHVPVIVMTSEKPAEVRSIKLGADDFITKPYDMPEVILARCERIIQLYEDKSVITAAEKDELTGLYTRVFFQEYIRQIDNHTDDVKMDAFVLNIEHFHMLNEMFGRSMGDEVLRKCADTLSRVLGDGICIGCRPDADYFYFYVSHREFYNDPANMLTKELVDLTRIPSVRIRIGVYQNVDKNIPIEDRFDHAKLTCDRLRGDYSRQIAYYNKEDNERDLYHERLINDIDKAIANKDLVVFYQPKYGIQGDEPELRSAEALIRWRHPKFGMISPGEFIPLFEGNGLIQKLDHFVWEEAARQIREWKDKFGITVPVSVNVSRVDIYDSGLENRLVDILKANNLEARELMLEITESAYADDAKGLVDVVERLRGRGFRIEMDDFGSGYSSLNMITEIPIDVLKMDMQFIRNMGKDEKSLKLVELVIEIADYLDVPVVAEGVEDEVQVKQLRDMGCELIQGYYFSKPVVPEEFEEFIKKEIAKKERD